MIIRYNSTTNIMASTLSQADLLEIYKAEGGGKSSWHDGRAPINLTTHEWCLLSWQDYKYKPIHDRQICLGKSNIFCTNVSLISLSSQYINQRMNVLFLQRQHCTFHVFSVKNLPATGKVSTIWCYLPTLDTKRTKMLRSAGFVNVLFLSYIELLILQVFEIEIFLHYT